MQNVEFKAELRDLQIARKRCELLGAKHLSVQHQTDTYFKMPDGRLKKRETRGEGIQWIFYHRPDNLRSKLSNYTILTDAQARTRWGTESLRPWVVVRKTRDLWIVDNVRIHLDEVERLGRFLEFEATISSKYNVAECHQILRHLREEFGPVMGEPISGSYADLMALDLKSAEERACE